MEIIIKKRPEDKKPKFIYEEPPKMTPREKEKWMAEEIERWQNGYGGLNGDYYFHLTQILIRTPRGKRIPPRWRDLDDQIFEWQYNVRRKKQDGVVFKKRRAAFSTIFGGTLPLKIALENPGMTCGMTSADKGRTNDMFREKTMVAFDSMTEDLNISKMDADDMRKLTKEGQWPGWFQVRQGTGTRMDSGKLYMDFFKKGKYSGDTSRVYCEQTTERPNDVTKFEGLALGYLLIDEYFLHPNPEGVRVSASASMMEDGGVKMGSAFLGGSCGLMSDEGRKNAQVMLEDMTRNPNSTMQQFFISGAAALEAAEEYDDHGIKTGRILNFCPNGYSDMEKATEWIKQVRGILEKKKDKKEYYQFLYAYPLSVEELFQFSRENWLTKDIMDLVQEQKINIMNNAVSQNRIVNRYALLDTDGKITAIRD